VFTVKDLQKMKADDSPYWVPKTASVRDALKLLADKNVGAVTVTDGDQMIGIFSERDYARKVSATGNCSLDMPVKNLMTTEMITVNLGSTLEECMNLMIQWHIRHLPIMDSGRLVGMVSMRDVVEALLSMKEDLINNLENYILGEGYAK
jgi:CBS domain-containing protein